MCSLGRGTLDDFGMSPSNLKTLIPRNCSTKKIITCSHKINSLETYKFKAVQKLKQAEHVVRVQFCNWLCEAVCKDENGPLLTYFTD
jgi:hypothetical protein